MGIVNNIKRQPSVLIENKVTFAAEDTELGIYDTYESVTGVKLQSDQILYCGMVTGKKVMHLEQSSTDFHPHESFVLAPNQRVLIDFPEASLITPTTCIAIEITPSRIQKVADKLNREAPREKSYGEWRYRDKALQTRHTVQTHALLTRIVELFCENTPDRAYLIDLAINELSARLLRQQTRDFIVSHSERDPEATHINAVISYIMANLDRPMDIEHLCQIAVMGRTKFFGTFKRHIGCSPIVFQQQERLKTAANMLAQGHQITETCFKVGFQNVSHFSKAFKNFFGLAPNHYRQKYRQTRLVRHSEY